MAGIFPLAGNFGTAFWVAVLTAGLGALMARDAGAGEAAAQAAALTTLAWIAADITVITLIAALLLPPRGGRYFQAKGRQTRQACRGLKPSRTSNAPGTTLPA